MQSPEFVARNIYIVFLSILVFYILLFNCLSLCWHSCHWLLWLVFLYSFLCITSVFGSLLQCDPQWWRVLVLLCLTHIVYVINLWIESCSSSSNNNNYYYYCYYHYLPLLSFFYVRFSHQVIVIYFFRVFHIRFFTGVWVTASLFKSPGLFSGLWPFSTMLQFRWSPLVL